MFKELIDIGRSAFDLLKNLLIAALIVCFFFFPSLINRTLADIGVSEFDLFGLKGKTSLAEVAQQLDDQRQANKLLETRLAESDRTLQAINGERDALRDKLLEANSRIDELARAVPGTAVGRIVVPPDTEKNRLVTDLLEANAAALASARAVQQETTDTLRANAAAISSAQTAVAQPGSRWGIVFGADTTAEQARFEVAKAVKAGFNARIYQRQRWFRSVAEFNSREAAASRLADVRGLSPTAKDAVIVDLSTWCPRQTEVGSGVIACAS
jgi:hypothetical protein